MLRASPLFFPFWSCWIFLASRIHSNIYAISRLQILSRSIPIRPHCRKVNNVWKLFCCSLNKVFPQISCVMWCRLWTVSFPWNYHIPSGYLSAGAFAILGWNIRHFPYDICSITKCKSLLYCTIIPVCVRLLWNSLEILKRLIFPFHFKLHYSLVISIFYFLITFWFTTAILFTSSEGSPVGILVGRLRREKCAAARALAPPTRP